MCVQLVEDWNVDAVSYAFTKLDPDKEQDKATVNKFFSWEGDFGGKKVADGKVFKWTSLRWQSFLLGLFCFYIII